MTDRVIEPVHVDLALDLGDEVDFDVVEEYEEFPESGLDEVREIYEMLGADSVEIDRTEDGGMVVRAAGEDALRAASALALSLVTRIPGGEARLREHVALLDIEDDLRGIE